MLLSPLARYHLMGKWARPGFSQAETPDRQSVSGLSYTLVCETPYTAGYTDVSACLVRTVQHILNLQHS
jgi:hypothetical protein